MKQLLAAVLMVGMVVGANDAFADNITQTVDVFGGTASFGAVHTDSVPFTDTFTFANITGQVLANASLVTIGFIPQQNIDFLSATLNGVGLLLSPNSFFEIALTPNELSLVAPLTLVVTGTSGASQGIYASYSGTLNVISVPEPTTVMLVGLGLLCFGIMVRRRQWA